MTLHSRRSQQSGVGPDGWCVPGHVHAQGCPPMVLPRHVPTQCLSWSTWGRSASLTCPLPSGMQALPEAGGREGRGGRAAARGLCCGRLLFLTPPYSWGSQSCAVGVRSAGV